MAETKPQTLDLTRRARPVIELDCGTFEMRRPEEFFFADFAKVAEVGEKIEKLAKDGLAKNATELDTMIQFGVGELLVDATDAAKRMPFRLFHELMDFFNGLVSKDEADTSENASSSSPGVSDSTEASEAA